jgi:hypothetical protein
MSKTTNSESRNVREPKKRELRDDELALVSGGWDAATNYSYLQAMGAWQNLLGHYGYPFQP